MKFQKEEKERVTLYRMYEERLDTQIAPDLKTAFLVDINAGRNQILLDLKGVNYIDSSGLGALLFGLRQIRENGGDLKLVHATPRVLKLIEIGHLENHLLNYDDEAGAIGAFE